MAALTWEFYKKIQKWEGDYQNHSEDNGNYNACGQQVGTNHGITSKTVETLMGIKCPDAAFMKSMTEEYAFQVLQKFMEFYRVDEIIDQPIAELVFNNFMGLPKKAAETVHLACNRFQANLAVDGSMGSKTLTALNSLAAQNQPAIYNAILDEWVKYLQTTNPTFRQGLLNRVNDLFFFIQPGTNAAPAPVAETNNLMRLQTILAGASKGDGKDLFAVGMAGVGFLALGAATYFMIFRK
jgi:lysozyme family protein